MWNAKSVALFVISLIAVIMFSMSMASADENKLSTTIKEMPNKVSNFVSAEVEKTKEYQKKSWAEAKTKWPWNKIFKGKDNE